MLNKLDYMSIFHEMKNSLTLINSSLQLLAKTHPDVEKYELWTAATQELTFLKNLVLEMSMSRTGQPLSIAPVNIYQLIGEVTNSIQSLGDDSNFHCVTDIEKDLPLIPMDAMRIKQALINLLKNAYDAMDHTGIIYFNIYSRASYLHMDIIDFGGGIIDSVKDSFQNAFVTSKECGTGLGLAITNQIIEEHSGKLEYESRPNDGCTFSILLPLF